MAKKKKKPADRKGSLGEEDLDAVSGGMGPAWTKGGGASVGQAVSVGLTPSPAGPIPVPYPTATGPAATEEQVIYKKLP